MGSRRFNNYCRDEEMKYLEQEATAGAEEAAKSTFVSAVVMVARCKAELGKEVSDSFLKLIADTAYAEDRDIDTILSAFNSWCDENI